MEGLTKEQDPISVDGQTVVERNRELASACLSGDEHAFNRMYNDYGSRIYNFCFAITGNREDAAEASQDAFCAFLERVSSLEHDVPRSLSSYLYTIARHNSIDMVRKRGRCTVSDDLPESEGELVELEEDPERNLLQKGQNSLLLEANNRMPERHRAVIAMREIEDLNYAEIGDVLGLNENAVAQLLSRARLRLKAEMRHQAVSNPPKQGDCLKAFPLLSRKLDGNLDPDGSKWLDAHLIECAECRDNLESMAEAGTTYRSLMPATIAMSGFSAKEAKAGLAEATGSAVRNELPKKGDKSLLKRAALIAAAICALLLIAVAVIDDGEVINQKQALQPGGAGNQTAMQSDHMATSTKKKASGKDKGGSEGTGKSGEDKSGSGDGSANSNSETGTGRGGEGSSSKNSNSSSGSNGSDSGPSGSRRGSSDSSGDSSSHPGTDSSSSGSDSSSGSGTTQSDGSGSSDSKPYDPGSGPAPEDDLPPPVPPGGGEEAVPPPFILPCPPYCAIH